MNPDDARGESCHGRAPRDELLVALGRRFRGVALKLEITLRMPMTRQLFRRDFVYLSRQLHALEASRRVQGLDRTLADAARATVARCAEASQVSLLQMAAEVHALVARQGQVGSTLAFVRSTRLQATVVCPLAQTFLDLLAVADDTLAELERAWLLGLIDLPAKVARMHECRQALRRFKETVCAQRQHVGEEVRRVNDTRRRAGPPTVPSLTSPATPALASAPRSASPPRFNLHKPAPRR